MIAAAFLFLLGFAKAYAQTDPSTALGASPQPSWNDGAAKKAITEFVKTTTEKGQSAVRLRLAASLPSPVALSKVNRNTPILIRNRSRVTANGAEKEKYIEH